MTLFPDYNENNWTKAHSGDWDAKIRQTHPGMASCAGGTPKRTCAECCFFAKNARKHHGDGSCKKAISMGVHSKNTVPKNADACRYFDGSVETKVKDLQNQGSMF